METLFPLLTLPAKVRSLLTYLNDNLLVSDVLIKITEGHLN